VHGLVAEMTRGVVVVGCSLSDMGCGGRQRRKNERAFMLTSEGFLVHCEREHASRIRICTLHVMAYGFITLDLPLSLSLSLSVMSCLSPDRKISSLTTLLSLFMAKWAGPANDWMGEEGAGWSEWALAAKGESRTYVQHIFVHTAMASLLVFTGWRERRLV